MAESVQFDEGPATSCSDAKRKLKFLEEHSSSLNRIRVRKRWPSLPELKDPALKMGDGFPGEINVPRNVLEIYET